VERERAEARLHQAQKMEALGQLAGGVAHDFNNSAAVVLAGLTLLEKRHGAALTAAGPAVLHLLAGLKDGAERGASVARRLLSFARREELRAADIEPAELLGALRDVLANALGPGVRVQVEAPAGLPALRADRARLETTLINLAVNARDAMPDGGTVVLGAATENLPSDRAYDLGLEPGAYVRLWVTDTGVGMDAATLARATEPFFTSKPKERGTGLGLSMADGFAAQSGGALRIESAPGAGTTVTLWLPRVGGVDTAEREAPHSGDKPPRRRALVVDDAAVMRRFLRDCLDHAGWETVEARDTQEALALLQTDGPFELLIADLLMPPGPDGLVLIRAARARQPGLPAILISGSEAPAGAAQAAREGFAVLRKPVSPTELSAFLEILP
jgi:CheY-like chemotaxis protein/nitrogen-specific signal transduction histidine kinase